jgi:hypothetical protein
VRKISREIGGQSRNSFQNASLGKTINRQSRSACPEILYGVPSSSATSPKNAPDRLRATTISSLPNVFRMLISPSRRTKNFSADSPSLMGTSPEASRHSSVPSTQTLSSSLRLANRGTLRSRVITASQSVIFAMALKIDPGVNARV